MKVLTEGEATLVKLAVHEGITKIQDELRIDFKVKPAEMTVHQSHRLSQIHDLLYTLFCEFVEERGSLQTEYDK